MRFWGSDNSMTLILLRSDIGKVALLPGPANPRPPKVSHEQRREHANSLDDDAEPQRW